MEYHPDMRYPEHRAQYYIPAGTAVESSTTKSRGYIGKNGVGKLDERKLERTMGNNRNVANAFLNQHCALALEFESMLLAGALKITF